MTTTCTWCEYSWRRSTGSAASAHARRAAAITLPLIVLLVLLVMLRLLSWLMSSACPAHLPNCHLKWIQWLAWR